MKNNSTERMGGSSLNWPFGAFKKGGVAWGGVVSGIHMTLIQYLRSIQHPSQNTATHYSGLRDMALTTLEFSYGMDDPSKSTLGPIQRSLNHNKKTTDDYGVLDVR